MEIGSVGTAGVGLQQQLAAARSPQQEYPDQTRVREEATRSSETQPNPQTVQANAPQTPERNELPQRSQEPKVYVNTQGQKTGSIINVTA